MSGLGKLLVGIGLAAAGGYVGYKYGQSSGINRFLATADDYEGLVSEEELVADVEEELVGEDDEFGDFDVEETEDNKELNAVKKGAVSPSFSPREAVCAKKCVVA